MVSDDALLAYILHNLSPHALDKIKIFKGHAKGYYCYSHDPQQIRRLRIDHMTVL